MGGKGADGEALSWCSQKVTNVAIVDGARVVMVVGDGDGSRRRRLRRRSWRGSAVMATVAIEEIVIISGDRPSGRH